MIRPGHIVVISATLHAALLALAVRWFDRRASIAATVPPHDELIEISVIPHDPIELAIPSDGPATAVASAHGPTRARHVTSATAIAMTSTSPVRSSAEPIASPFMRMRGAQLQPDRAAMESIAAGGSRPAAEASSGMMHDAPNGRAVVDVPATTMTVDRDGTAQFHDKHVDAHYPIANLARGLIDPKPLFHDLGDDISAWYADPQAGTRFGRMQDLPQALQADPSACSQWGDQNCDDPNAPESERRMRGTPGESHGLALVHDVLTMRDIVGTLDISAYVMRKAGIDPFASRKLALLDATRDERAARGSAYRAEQLARSAELMRTNLERLWASATTTDERRAVLFELWDECAEGDGEIGEAGERARATVIGWIRAKHVAYSTDELAELNHRRASRQEFVP